MDVSEAMYTITLFLFLLHTQLHMQLPAHAYSHYHAWGLKSSYAETIAFDVNAKFLTLFETIQRLNHFGRKIDIFKIDCEGCEWTSFKDWINSTSELVDIRQILVEIHGATHRPSDVTLHDFFQTFLDQGFVPFYKEANTHPNAKPPGTLYEYAFIKLAPSFFRKDEV
jgi:hypothetical protein